MQVFGHVLIAVLCHLSLSLLAVVEFDLFFLLTDSWRMRLLGLRVVCGAVDRDDAALV